MRSLIVRSAVVMWSLITLPAGEMGFDEARETQSSDRQVPLRQPRNAGCSSNADSQSSRRLCGLWLRVDYLVFSCLKSFDVGNCNYVLYLKTVAEL